MRRETVSEKLSHFIDKNCLIMLLLCFAYVFAILYVRADEVNKAIYNNFYAGSLIIVTLVSLIFTVVRSIKVLKENHQKLVRPLILFLLLFLAFFSIYRASFHIYYTGGEANSIFMIIIDLMMKVFGYLFFAILVSLTLYYMLIHSDTKNDKIKMCILFLLSFILFIECNIYKYNNTIATYTSITEALTIFVMAVSAYNYFYLAKISFAKISSENLAKIIGCVVFIIFYLYIFIRDYNQLLNFLNENIFRESYDILMLYIVVPIVLFTFLIIVIDNHKKIILKNGK